MPTGIALPTDQLAGVAQRWYDLDFVRDLHGLAAVCVPHAANGDEGRLWYVEYDADENAGTPEVLETSKALNCSLATLPDGTRTLFYVHNNALKFRMQRDGQTWSSAETLSLGFTSLTRNSEGGAAAVAGQTHGSWRVVRHCYERVSGLLVVGVTGTHPTYSASPSTYLFVGKRNTAGDGWDWSAVRPVSVGLGHRLEPYPDGSVLQVPIGSWLTKIADDGTFTARTGTTIPGGSVDSGGGQNPTRSLMLRVIQDRIPQAGGTWVRREWRWTVSELSGLNWAQTASVLTPSPRTVPMWMNAGNEVCDAHMVRVRKDGAPEFLLPDSASGDLIFKRLNPFDRAGTGTWS